MFITYKIMQPVMSYWPT